MSTSWDLKELRAYAKRTSDTATLELINSIDRSNLVFEYHFFTARDALKGILNFEEPQAVENGMFILGGSDRQEEFAYAKVASEANLISCIYTARSLLETFAQLVNRIALGSAIEVSKCTPKTVVDKLPTGELKIKLQELLVSDWFSYTSAFTNTVKHRQLIQHQASISFIDNVVGIKIGAFNYEKSSYPAYWINEVLQGAITVKNEVIALGQILNRNLPASNA